MSEATFRRALIKLMRPFDACAIESSVGVGIPDINYCCGWLELKYLPKWPIRAETIIRLPHFSAEQKIWLSRRYRTSQNAYLVLKIGRQEYLLFDGVTASSVGKANKTELLNSALFYTTKIEKICEYLHKDRKHAARTNR